MKPLTYSGGAYSPAYTLSHPPTTSIDPESSFSSQASKQAPASPKRLLTTMAKTMRAAVMHTPGGPIPDFEVMAAVPTVVCLTTYQGDEKDFVNTPLEEMVQQIKKGTLKVSVGKTFPLHEIVEAHRTMEESRAGGKIFLLM